MDLTDFLLARIAEDESVARRGGDGGGFYPDDCWEPEQIVADCKAKRQIVDEAVRYSPELEHGDTGEWAFDVTLRHLAAIYADHPDYRDEWRP